MTQSRQHGVAVLCTLCLVIFSGSFGSIEDISHQEVSFKQAGIINQPYQENLVLETNETDGEFISEIGTLQILEANLRALTNPTHHPIQVYDLQENHNHTYQNDEDSEESDLVLSDWQNAIIRGNDDHSFHSKSNNHHHHENKHEDETSAKSRSHHDHGHRRNKSNSNHNHGHTQNHEDEAGTKSDSPHDHGHNDKHEESNSHDENVHSHSHEDETSTKSLPTSVWLTSLASICVISLVGVAAVAAIPQLQGPH